MMKSILVIHATPPASSLAQRILRRAGYIVDGARDGREAADLARARPPDLVYAGRDAIGFERPADLRALPGLAGVPILAEVNPRRRVRPRGEEAGGDPGVEDVSGADETIEAPVNPFELLAKVRFLIGDDVRRPPPRLAIRRDAHVESGEIHALGALVNLSASGAFLETEAAGAIADPVRVRFALPEVGREISATGRVVRRVTVAGRPPGLALQFLDLDAEARRDLEEFLFLKG
jgi:CheY-like chemotaxis protein